MLFDRGKKILLMELSFGMEQIFLRGDYRKLTLTIKMGRINLKNINL
ncbi:hypothetical protein HMPREF9075_00459 [Capnocytophaga sp. oral taxon 332 str. F0381]|nr:hypothetical protein HMPREF9075_00459 [Capnocytophaga sp. oral taxon 332 str. F0381]